MPTSIHFSVYAFKGPAGATAPIGVSGMVSMAHNNDRREVALTLDGEHVVEVYGITRR
jgi:hypothetical protein